jgi:hypothetical protein
MVEQSSPANLMDVTGHVWIGNVAPKETAQKWTIEFDGMPLFEVNARHPGVFPSQMMNVTLNADKETGSIFHERKPSKPVSSHSYFEQSNAAHKFMQNWYGAINNPPDYKRFSVRSHKRGATLIYHTGIANVEIEFRSQRLARVHGKRYTLNFTHSY